MFLSAFVGASVNCSRCKNVAVELDCFWPYYTDGNRCMSHLYRDNEAESNVGANLRAEGPSS